MPLQTRDSPVSDSCGGDGAPEESSTARGDKSRRGALAGIACLIVLTALVFGDVLFCRNPTVVSGTDGDIFHTFLGWRQWGFGQWKGGEFPSWDPYAYSGKPFFGNMQSALLYPPNVIYWMLPTWRALNLEVALSVFLSGLFCFYWIRSRGVSAACSVYGASLTMFGAAHFLHIAGGHLPNLDAMAWTPLLFWAADQILDSPLDRDRNRGVGLAALALGMIMLAGHVQYFYYSALAFGLYTVVRAVRRPDLPALQCARRCQLAAGSVSLGLGLAAPQLLPGALLANESMRQGGLTYATAGTFALPPWQLLATVVRDPFGVGTNAAGVPYWGPWVHWEMGVFVGVPALLLAVHGARFASRRERTENLTLLAIICILALGGYTFFFAPVYHLLPGYKSFRGAAKWSYFALPILSLLAARGLQNWTTSRRGAGLLACLALTIALLGIAGWATIGIAASGGVGGTWGHFMHQYADGWPSSRYRPLDWYQSETFVRQAAEHARRALLSMTGMASLAALSAWLRIVPFTATLVSPRIAPAILPEMAQDTAPSTALKRRWIETWAWAALPALGVAQLIFVARASLPVFDPSAILPPTLQAQLAKGPADARYLQTFDFNAEAGVLTGLHDLRGDDPFMNARYAKFLAYSQGYDLLNLSQVFIYRHDSPLFRFVRCIGVLSQPRPNVYTLNRFKLPPLPHVFLADRWELSTKENDTLATMASPQFDAAKTVLLEAAPPLIPATATGVAATATKLSGVAAQSHKANPRQTHDTAIPGTAAVARKIIAGRLDAGSASVVGETASSLTISAHTTSPAFLVVTDQWSPGWEATALPGSSQGQYAMQRADFLLRAIPLAPGNHLLRLSYEPPGRWPGLAIFGVSLLAWISLWGPLPAKPKPGNPLESNSSDRDRPELLN